MNERPLILVTNDDGVRSPGLHALADAARTLGDVVVVAPDREMSAASHAITLHRPLRIDRGRDGAYALSGTPVDCTYMGIHHIAERRPTLVVSGINPGPNLGCDVHYSGTLAAAREATIHGVPGVAFSAASRASDAFEGTQPILVAVMRSVLEHGLPKGVTLNVNIPAEPCDPPVYRTTRLGSRPYAAEVVRRLDPRGREYLWIGGGAPELENTPGTDAAAILAGEVSLTPVSLFQVSDASVEALAGWSLFNGHA